MRVECQTLDLRLDANDSYCNRAHLEHVFCELVCGIYDVDVEGKQVVDVGAYYGETAIYFSRNGASMVYAYEPFASGEHIEPNAAINGCSNIVWVRKAIGSENTEISVDPTFDNNGSTRLYYAAKSGATMQQVTLEFICNTHEIDNGVLKMDCEGGEFNSLGRASQETLRRFSSILVEVHSYLGSVERLAANIERAGFEIIARTSAGIRTEHQHANLTWHCVRKG